MLKNFILVSCCVALLSGCAEKVAENQPSDLIPRDSIIEVMKEISLVEAVYQKRMINTLNQRDSAITLFAKIFAEYNISQDRFTRSFEWYKRDPNEAEKLFDDIISKLSKLDAEVKASADDSLIQSITPPPAPQVLIVNADSLRQDIIRKQREKRKEAEKR